MPELPEVETIKRDVQAIVGNTIISVHVSDGRVIRNATSAKFKSSLVNRKIERIERIGKALVFRLSPKIILTVQLGMSGHIFIGEKMHSKETKLVFLLSNGKYLNYNDHRMFGRLNMINRLEDLAYFKSAGPDPLSEDFNVDYIFENCKKRRIPIKVLLLNQRFVAGIGNIYASEILFDAGINPSKPAQDVNRAEAKRIDESSKKILKWAISHRGTTLRNYKDASGSEGNFKRQLLVYRRENENCLKCKQKIVKIVQAQRSTFYCARCQS